MVMLLKIFCICRIAFRIFLVAEQ